MRFPRVLHRLDWALLACALLLSALGVSLLATAGEATAVRALAVRQGLFLVAALGGALLLGRTHYSIIRSLAGPLYGVTLLLLALTLFQGHAIRGAAAWIVIGGTQVQPGEIMKVALVLVLARIVSGNRGPTLSWKRLLLALVAVGVPSVVMLRQPDLGTLALLLLVAFGMLILAGVRRSQWLLLLGGMAIGLLVAWQFLFAEYQKERVRVFLQPTRDPLGAGYTVIQARTAFGSGGLTGRGLGWGPQSRLNFLPEVHTDFAFARIGEELGLLGVTVTLTLFGILLARMLRAARRTSDAFGRVLAAGAALALLVGFAVNAGMNVGLLPVTGVPLPLVSYGGSSLLVSYLFVGLAASVGVHGERWESTDAETALVEAHA